MAIGRDGGCPAWLGRTASGRGGGREVSIQRKVPDVGCARDVVGIESMLPEDARTDVRAESAVAGDGGRLGLIEFSEALAEGVERNVARMLGPDELEFGALVGVA